MSEIVFILGAGASKDAGAPVMSNFLEMADEIRKNNDIQNYKEDFERVLRAISNLERVHSKSFIDLDNIESVFAAFEMCQLIDKLPEMDSNEIKELLVSARKLILKTLEQTIKYPVQNESITPSTSYNNFAKLISKLNKDYNNYRCTVITFNYDLALDYAFSFNGISYDYCLSETEKSYNIPYLKLHGSVNWGRCRECGAILPWEMNKFLSRYHPLLFSNTKSVPIYMDLSKSELKHCDTEIDSIPFIVPPTWNKSNYHEFISPVWKKAAYELSNAENIFVLGYSLPETDKFFTYLYALGSVGQTRLKRFWVFNPDQNVFPRFKDLIGRNIENKFKSYPVTFNESFKIINEAFPVREYEDY